MKEAMPENEKKKGERDQWRENGHGENNTIPPQTTRNMHAGNSVSAGYFYLAEDEATPKETAKNAPYFINNKMVFPLGE